MLRDSFKIRSWARGLSPCCGFLMNGPAPTTLPQIDGYLGTSKLNARRIDFDFRNNTLGWNR